MTATPTAEPRLTGLSLRSKIVLILSGVIGLYAALDHVVQRWTFAPIFSRLERAEAEEDLQRVVEGLRQEVAELHALCLDWSAWDDTYRYVGEPNEAYERSNLGSTSLQSRRIDLIFICDEAGRVVWGSITDPDTGEEIRLRDFPRGRWGANHFLLVDPAQRIETDEAPADGGQGHGTSGLWTTEHAPLLVSSRPILTSQRDGEPRGRVVLGRFLAQGLNRKLAERTKVAFDAWLLDGRPLPPTESAVADEVTASARPIVRPADAGTLHVYGTFPDIRRNSALLLRANVDRRITQTGGTSLRYALISTVVAGLLMLLVLLGLIQRTVLGPLMRLTRHTVRIGRDEDFNAKLGMQRGDEVGVLSREFDQMMEKLEASRAALVKTARSAGMSEIATGILHNVGNVLNSVNIAASVAAQKVESMSVTDLQKLTHSLRSHADDLGTFVTRDPKGKHLVPYLDALGSHLGKQRSGVLGELASLADGIDHIRELIKSQQNYAVQSDLIELVSIPSQVEEALNIADKAIPLGPEVEIVRDWQFDEPCLLDRHRLLEILVNLVQNARHALHAHEGAEKRLTLRLYEAEPGRLRIEVADTGIGIPPENLTRIFSLGFTTRSEGHGYGLHTSANAAVEMGGSLVAQSAGAGRGATFVLELPKRTAPRPTGAPA